MDAILKMLFQVSTTWMQILSLVSLINLLTIFALNELHFLLCKLLQRAYFFIKLEILFEQSLLMDQIFNISKYSLLYIHQA